MFEVLENLAYATVACIAAGVVSAMLVMVEPMLLRVSIPASAVPYTESWGPPGFIRTEGSTALQSTDLNQSGMLMREAVLLADPPLDTSHQSLLSPQAGEATLQVTQGAGAGLEVDVLCDP